jgi:ATPase subunit of ABC transporter with duplicated ATPase domains
MADAPAPENGKLVVLQELAKRFGTADVLRGVNLEVARGEVVVIIGPSGSGKTTLLRMLAGVMEPDTGEVVPGHGLKLGYYAQEHETLDADRSVLENARSASPDLNDTEVRKVLGSFLFSGDDVEKPAGVLSGGEKTRLALACLVTSSANVLLLDEPTNNLDPASREEILSALAGYKGAVVLVTHDDGAVLALNPDKVLMLPDGVEDNWSPDLTDLVALA